MNDMRLASARHAQRGPGDVACFVRCKEQNGIGDFARLPDTAHGHQFMRIVVAGLAQFLEHRRGSLGFDRPRDDGVDAYAMLGEFHRRVTDETVDTSLRGRTGGASDMVRGPGRSLSRA